VILDRIIGVISAPIVGKLTDSLTDVAKAYFNKEISEAEFKSRTAIAVQESFRDVEKSWAEASAKIADSTQESLRSSVVLQRGWVAVLFLQLVVLLWYQVGTPVYEIMAGEKWPEPMASIEWAYLLIGAQIGSGPLIFRRGGKT
jgi:hypothetical protein